MTNDDEVGRQILGIFIKHRVLEYGVLRRNHFIAVRGADFQLGSKKAVEYGWIKIYAHDRYKYELTRRGLVQDHNLNIRACPGAGFLDRMRKAIPAARFWKSL